MGLAVDNFWGQQCRAFHVFLEDLCELLADRAVIDIGVTFEIEGITAIVLIHRANKAEGVVTNSRLGVHEAVVVDVDFNARGGKKVSVILGRSINKGMVRHAGDHDADVDARSSGND